GPPGGRASARLTPRFRVRFRRRLFFPNVGIRPPVAGILATGRFSRSKTILTEGTSMKAIPVATLLLTVAVSAAAYAAAPNYHVVDRIKVGDGGFDYAVFDSANNRALIARTNYTLVIDGKTNKVSQLSSASAGHMAIPIPNTNLLVLPQG